MTTSQATRQCSLEAAVGSARPCPGGACPFWEAGGAVLAGRCAFEELGVTADPGLAAWLLEIRERLGAAGSAEEERALRGAFHHLLNDAAE